jgi:ubiquinone/menaquinone biosynthesis C-methylase UbiE
MLSKDRPHIDRILGRYKSEEFLSLLERWAENLGQKKLLKTDLNEEAFGADQILFSLPNNLHIFGLDISEDTVRRANINQPKAGLIHNYIRADVRDLPFEKDTFDIILSTSTLDHFTNERDFIKSLLELKRIIKPTGLMIIAINNKHNLNFYLSLKIGRLLGLIPYPVQFYSLKKLKKIFQYIGLTIQDRDSIVHIISPINTVMLLFRRLMKNETIDKLSKKCVSFFRWLGIRKNIRTKTGWFIVLKCKKMIRN